MIDPVELAGRLVALDTCGGGERDPADLLAGLLADGGFDVRVDEAEPGRANLVARRGAGPPTTLTGHLDTVPADPAGWSFDPHAGDVVDGRLRGRGTTDMKAGVAAITVAALRAAAGQAPDAALQLVFTFGEETGCEGARRVTGLVPSPLLLVAEPTSNRVLHGHKGVLWLRLVERGTSAHGSRPDLGRNALVALARTAAAVHDHGAAGRWPVSDSHGPATANPGVLRSGTQPNLVPDRAELELDLRLVPGFDADAARAQVAALAGGATTIETMIDLPAVSTDPADPRAARVAAELGHAGAPGYASYFTDASVLVPALRDPDRGDPAVLVYGPGDPELAHVTDETCSAANIVACTDGLVRACLTACAAAPA